MTVRLRPDDLALFCAVARDAGLEPSVAARQILEIFVHELRACRDYIEVLHSYHGALKAALTQAGAQAGEGGA